LHSLVYYGGKQITSTEENHSCTTLSRLSKFKCHVIAAFMTPEKLL